MVAKTEIVAEFVYREAKKVLTDFLQSELSVLKLDQIARMIANAIALNPRFTYDTSDKLPVTVLDLDKRTKNALLRNGIHFVDDLRNLGEHELLQLSGIGLRSVEKIKAALVKHGITLKPQ